jgi:hypothetical protein
MTSPSVLTPSPPFCHPERKRGVFFPFYPKQYEAFEDVFLGVYENEKVKNISYLYLEVGDDRIERI